MHSLPPLAFAPYCRPQVWGGQRLAQDLRKSLPSLDRYGEAWEISAHPHHVSKVAEGPLQGQSLEELWRTHSTEILGRPRRPEEKFPWLIKLLDCQELLSVQVHPNDAIAARLLGDELGKTEAWVILAADPTAKIFAGLKRGVDRATLEQALETGDATDCLHQFHPRPGDCLFLPAGVVHAVGGGVLMAEVQQTSDATFRLFDWNRLGADGKPRQLHIEQALESIAWDAGPVEPIRLPSTPEQFQELASCPHFRLQRVAGHQPFKNPHTGRLSVWMVLAVGARLIQGENYERTLGAGETILIPATTPETFWRPNPQGVTLLTASLP